jgi:hypothetical protein
MVLHKLLGIAAVTISWSAVGCALCSRRIGLRNWQWWVFVGVPFAMFYIGKYFA